MNQQIVIQQLNDVVYAIRGKGLLDSEYRVLLGMLEELTYDEMSIKFNYHPNHVTNLGMTLLRIFSKHFQQKITKKNFVFFCETYLAQDKI